LAYTLTGTHEDRHVSPQIMLVLLRISIHVFWIYMQCLWSDHSEFMVFLMVFNLLIGPGFIF